MHNSRQKMLDKVKAILAKTMSNGCTEEEAMTALTKAREMMAAYDISEDELNVDKSEKANIYRSNANDPYDIKKNLAVGIGKFTRCKAWKEKTTICFCGLESDAIFAEWLLNTLQRFVMRALRAYQADRMKKKIPTSTYTSASFVAGCASRIAEKLKELTPVEPVGKGLVISRHALIDAEMAKHGITLHKSRSSRDYDKHAASMGQKAGDGARFDRPVNSGGRLMLK